MWISTIQFHCTEQAASPLLFMTQLNCELHSQITLNRPPMLQSWQGQYAILCPLPGPPHPPSRTLTSSSAQWSQLMAFIWTNSLLTSVSSTCHTIVFTCLWLVIFTFVGFFDHHHVYIRKTMSFLQGPNTGCAPGYDWRHKHSCFSFLALPCLSQTPSHFSRRCSLYIFLCLLPSHSTFHYPSV